MKKALTVFLVLLVAFSVFAKGSAESKKTELNVIISQYGNYTQDWWPKFEQKFEENNPDIDLKIEIVSWNDLYTVVGTRISTNQQPDILNIDTFSDYVADDLLVPTEKYVSDAVKNKIFPGFWSANDLNGTVWALPILASARALFYNKDILKAAGVSKVPETWDEVLDACAKIKAYDSKIVPWSLDISTDEGQAAFSYYSWNNGGGFTDAKGNWTLNSKENVEAIEFMKTLIDSGYTTANPYTETRYPQQDAFAAGSLAMMLGPCNLYDIASNVNFGVASMPTNGGNKSVNMGVCDRLMVFKREVKDENVRLAAISKFFDAFYDEKTYAEYMVFEGFLPVTSDSTALLAKNAEQFEKGGNAGKGNSKYFSDFIAILGACNFYPTAKPEWNDVKQGVIKAEQEACIGKVSAKDALDALQKQIVK
ncbi:MAG: extracellular solute-binding protein [Sphaerochaetaceae bacterium]|nr:extracellular solute-binding protein [Sphaerochaetaceae bacterium]